MLLSAGVLAMAFALHPQQETPRKTRVGEWEIMMVNAGARRMLAVTSSDVIIQIRSDRNPALIAARGHNCPGKPMIIKVDENAAILLGEKGRRQVKSAVRQMLAGRKATIAYYESPCESASRVEIDLAELAEALDIARSLTDEEKEELEALFVAEEEAHQQAAEDDEKKRNPIGALLNAARDGDLVQVLASMRAGADVNARSGINRYTPLIWASVRGHTDIVYALLEAGAEVEYRLADGQTALMRASDNGHIEIVKALLEAGADVNATTERGMTALRLAELRDHEEIVELLKKAGAKD